MIDIGQIANTRGTYTTQTCRSKRYKSKGKSCSKRSERYKRVCGTKLTHKPKKPGRMVIPKLTTQYSN